MAMVRSASNALFGNRLERQKCATRPLSPEQRRLIVQRVCELSVQLTSLETDRSESGESRRKQIREELYELSAKLWDDAVPEE